MRLLGYFGLLLRCCNAVAKVSRLLLGCSYVVARVLWVITKVLQCGC